MATYPWIIGREPLLEDALDGFTGELGRAAPWKRARHNAILGGLEAALSGQLGRPAPLAMLDRSRADAWLAALDPVGRALAHDALADFRDYLLEWRWTETDPLAA